jgi:glycosyltransferase involved in cell wall biosynthesis
VRTTPVNPDLLRAVRQAVTLVCLAPLLAGLAGLAALAVLTAVDWAARLVDPRRGTEPALVVSLEPPVGAGYPYLIMAVTAASLYLAYGRYEDPARYLLRRRPAPPQHPLRRRAATRHHFPPLPPAPTVSLLMAVRDDAAGVVADVHALAATEHGPLEIILVDDGSTDGTADALDRLADSLPIAVLRLDRSVGRRGALVHAAGYATGDVLALVGDRCLLAPDAIGRCVDALVRHPELGAVGGHTRARNAAENPLTRVQDACSEGRFRVGVAAAAAFGAVTDLTGGLAVFRRDAVYNYLPAWSADRPLAALILGQPWTGRALKNRYAESPFVRHTDHPERPWQVGYVRSARVYATAPTRPGRLVAQMLRRAAATARAARFTGGFIWRRGAAPAGVYYGRLLAVALAPLAAGWHLLWTPLHGQWGPAALYLGAALLSGVTLGLATAIERPGEGGWAYRPLTSLLSAVLLPLLPAYAIIRRLTAPAPP